MKNSHTFEAFVSILLIIGGLELGLMGLFDINVISSIFGMASVLTRASYIVIGLAAAYRVIVWLKCRSGSCK